MESPTVRIKKELDDSTKDNLDLVNDEEIERLKRDNTANNFLNNSSYSLNVKSEFKQEDENNFVTQDDQFNINESNDEEDESINEKRQSEKPGKVQIKCEQCGVLCRNKKAYNAHLISHTEERPFKCSLCQKSYKHSRDLTYHMKLHTGKHDSHCEVCGQSGFTLQSVFRTHMLTHTKDKPYVCTICGTGFLNSSELKPHMDIHNNDYSFQCKECDVKFQTKAALSKHSMTHKAQPFQCEICFKILKSKNNKKTHMEIHLGQGEGEKKQMYSCDQCGKKYTNIRSLKYHMKCHRDDLFKCHMCDKSYMNRGDLRTHLRTHTGEKPFECDICKQRFAYRASFNIHKRIHDSNRETFKCDLCDKVLATKNALRGHRMSVHSTEISHHQCGQCEKKFKARHSLMLHLDKYHSDPLPDPLELHPKTEDKEQKQQALFKCHLCKKSYLRESSLRLHLQKHAEGMKFFKCKICGQKFTTSSDLESHKTTDHTNKCDVCSKVFENNNSMRIHRKLQHFMEPVSCKLCGLKMKKNKMKAHLSKHRKKGELIERTEEIDRSESVCQICQVDCSAEGLEVHMLIHDVKPFKCDCLGLFFSEIEYKKHLKDDCEMVKGGLEVTEDFKPEIIKEELDISYDVKQELDC